MTDAFTWLDGERLIGFGEAALDGAPALLEARGFDDFALLTTVRFEPVATAFAERAATVALVPAGGVPDIAAAVREVVAGRPVVALGGGRVIDTAKALAAADGTRCAAIPTTLSGAEMTGFHRLPAGVERAALVRPALIVADPALMASQPLPERLASALNALAHAVEAVYSPLANPVSTLAGLRAAELFGHAEASRDEIALAALLAGYASGQVGYAIHHVVSQTLVRVGGLPHAQTNAVVLPHTLDAMAERAPRQVAELARALGGSDAATEVRRIAGPAGVTGLRAIGFDPALVGAVVDAAAGRAELANTPGPPPGRADLERLVRAAL